MATKKLAKELGLLRQRSKSSSGSRKSLLTNQIFSYLIVIDFESTCWREKNNFTQEIIEFPAVLLNTSTGEVQSEFHAYVQPQEHPVLSQFCTELTGITQMQVEAGIPLHICLSRFSRWLQNLQLEMGLIFPNGRQRSAAPSPSEQLCAFVTWSDWDLGVCLQYECKRKQLHKPDVLNSWIDLRSTYRLFYDRKPKGLNGALQDLGIQFSGREHSGLDDSRNTAQLAARMMRDGCVMKITRSLEKMPLTTKPTFGKATTDNKKCNADKEENTNKPSSSKTPPPSRQIKSHLDNISRDLATNESLISPKTLLNGTSTPLWGCSSVRAAVKINRPSPRRSSSLVLCSTTMGCLSNLPQPTTPGAPVEEEGAELLVEPEDRRGSYDDVVLEGYDDEVIGETEREFDYVSEFDSGCDVWEEPDDDDAHSPGAPRTLSVERKFKTQKMNKSPTTSRSTREMRSHVDVSDHVDATRQHSTINTYFAVPKAVKSNQHKAGIQTFLQVREKSDESNKISKTNTSSLFRRDSFIPEKSSTPFTSFTRPKAVVTTKHHDAPKSSFTIYTDSAKPSSRVSVCAPENVLSSLSTNALSWLSTNALSSRTDRSSVGVTMKGGPRITSPLCACGRRAKRQVVSNGGPNHGRGFYCCPVRRSGGGGRIQKGCEFFKWESALMKSSSVAPPAVGASVSLCGMNSTLSGRPPQRSTLRKSY